jgi:hypothetical protein
MSRSARSTVVLAVAAAIYLSAAAPSAAKAFTLDKLEITGPGLDEPMIVTERQLGRSNGEGHPTANLLSSFLGEYPRTSKHHEWLGPGYRIEYHFELVVNRNPVNRNPRSAVGHQYVYPYAIGGPITFTPPDQKIRILPSRLGDSWQIVEGGWWPFPISIVEQLQRLGLPPPPETSARVNVARDVRVEGLPWAAVAGGPRGAAVRRASLPVLRSRCVLALWHDQQRGSRLSIDAGPQALWGWT